MGSEVCADELQVTMCGNLKLINKVVDQEEEAGPATPDENGEHNHNHKHHDFSSSSPSPPPPPCCNDNGLETPKDTLFDSFAPASDKFLLAPHHRKYRKESHNLVVRRLDFTKDSTSAWSSDEEDRLFDIVYATIMDAILAEQQQQQQGKEEAAAAGGGTPKSAPFLNGIAETCPAAPIKSGRKHRFIDKEICKKLAF